MPLGSMNLARPDRRHMLTRTMTDPVTVQLWLYVRARIPSITSTRKSLLHPSPAKSQVKGQEPLKREDFGQKSKREIRRNKA